MGVARRDEVGGVRRAVRLAAALAAVLLAAVGVGAQADRSAASTSAVPTAIPAYRQARNIAVITLEGEISATTELSMKRRIRQAEESGADAIVIEIDSPGGEVGAVLEISNAIKASSIDNTVAWINPDAYSGGAIVALACRELVTSDPASMGDAFPITFGAQGIRGLTADERTKILPPLLSDVADSARRSGFDEYLVQAMVVDGIELWAAKDTETERWVFINEAEARVLFDGDPPRGKPLLTSVPNGRASSRVNPAGVAPAAEGGETDDTADAAEPDTESAADAAPIAMEPDPEPPSPLGDTAGELGDGRGDGPTGFLPANASVDDLTELVSQGLEVASTRPVMSEALRGRFVDLTYVCDGTGPIVMRHDQLRRFGLSTAIIETDAELLAFFGGETLARTDMSWSEKMVGVLTSLPVRGLLIVVLLVGLFFEMISPGTLVGGGVALTALVLLLAPPALIGLASWWEIAAIAVGGALVLVEALALPGMGLLGVAGLALVFVGLVGTFIPDGSGGLFGAAGSRDDLYAALATITLAIVTAGIIAFFIFRHFGRIPLLSRLVLDADRLDPDGVDPDTTLLAAGPARGEHAAVGDTGVAVTRLMPSGRVDLDGGGPSIDAIARRGFIEDNARVRLVERRGFAWVVEPDEGDGTGGGRGG